jgi:hypothetical protein
VSPPKNRGKLHRWDKIGAEPGDTTRWRCRDCGLVEQFGRFGPQGGLRVNFYRGGELVASGTEGTLNMPMPCPGTGGRR